MARKVVVIASGETERQALPRLLGPLVGEEHRLVEVRIPPRHRALRPDTVEQLIKAVWFGSQGTEDQPDKFVVLLDADGRDPEEVLESVGSIAPRVRSLGAELLLAYAQWHLEAWYFADGRRLRRHLGRSLGRVKGALPDEIENPKLHLSHLLEPTVYTSRVSAEIASSLDPHVIQANSPSFSGFVEAVRNGSAGAAEGKTPG